MRLIDADEFKEIIVTYGKAGFAALRINKICELIDSQTTAYDVDKVVEQMEEYVKESSNVDYNRAMIEAIEIVKSGGLE